MLDESSSIYIYILMEKKSSGYPHKCAERFIDADQLVSSLCRVAMVHVLASEALRCSGRYPRPRVYVLQDGRQPEGVASLPCKKSRLIQEFKDTLLRVDSNRANHHSLYLLHRLAVPGIVPLGKQSVSILSLLLTSTHTLAARSWSYEQNDISIEEPHAP